jgi:DNA primase
MLLCLLLRLPQEIIICADGDGAGQKAADKLAKRLHGLGMACVLHRLSQGQDFNDILRREG